MKYFHYIIFIISLIACGGSGGDNPPPEPPVAVNKAPSTPTQSAPTNNQLCIDNVVTFEWNAATDPEGDAITYELQIATNNLFSQNLQTRISTSTTTSISLEKGVAYYWRIRSDDSRNNSSGYSSTFSFYTEGDGVSNHLPFSPAIVTPALNATVQVATTTLEWTASDVDTNDTLTFDIYLDTVNPPASKVSENQLETILNVDLTASQSYYWKVVVKDDKGGITIGQVWNFQTD